MTPTRSTIASIALVGALALVPSGVALAAPADPATGAPAASSAAATGGRVVVKFHEDAPEADRAAAYAQAASRAGTPGLQEGSETVDGARVVTSAAALQDAQLDALTTALAQDPAVEYAAPDRLAGTSAVPNDPEYKAVQWSLWDDPAGLGMPLAWDRATGRGQTIAIVDTGITAHPDLDANVLPGRDFVSVPQNARDGDGWDADPTDRGDYPDATLCPTSPQAAASTWHGTQTAGIAAADGNNGVGISGVAPDARILPVRAVGACSLGYISDVAAGISWAVGAQVPGVPVNPTPATVVNLSLAVEGQCPPVLQQAISDAVSRGVPVVVAAGNQSIDAARTTPSNCAGVISVAATDIGGAGASYSNFGAVTLAAPGGSPWGGIRSTGNAGAQGPAAASYRDGNGTSMAAPAVAGTVALLQQLSPGLGVEGVRQALTSTARQAPGGCPAGCGAGMIDPVSALVQVQGGDPFTVSGGIARLHEKIGASTGEPVSRQICATSGSPCFQEFETGWIVWSTARGARWINGPLPTQWWTIG